MRAIITIPNMLVLLVVAMVSNPPLPAMATFEKVDSLSSTQSARRRIGTPNWRLPRQSAFVSVEPRRQNPSTSSVSAQPLREQPTDDASQLQQRPLEAAPSDKAIQLTLPDVVALLLANNRSLKNAYLERIVQRADLAVEESKFTPRITPGLSLSYARSTINGVTTSPGALQLQGLAAWKLPIGTDLSVGLIGNLPTTLMGSPGFGDNLLRQEFNINLNQPLLRRAGIKVNTASIKLAQLSEQGNVLALKSTLIDTLTSAILAFRELLRAQEQLKIEQSSLKSAQELLEFNRVLIEAGRVAPVEIVQSETAVANREVSLVTAQNNLAARQLDLITLLGLDGTPLLVAVDSLTIPTVLLEFNQLKQIALENQPNYLQTQLAVEKTKFTLLLAENNRLWDLSLNVNFSAPYAGILSTDTLNNLQAGLILTREFGDLSLDRDVLRSRTSQSQAENTLKDETQKLEIQITNLIRESQLSRSQLDLAHKATELSERQLQIQAEKQKLGRGSTIFELVRLQNDLAAARNQELNARINYLNTLTRLDQVLGTTLTTWKVALESEAKQ